MGIFQKLTFSSNFITPRIILTRKGIFHLKTGFNKIAAIRRLKFGFGVFNLFIEYIQTAARNKGFKHKHAIRPNGIILYHEHPN